MEMPDIPAFLLRNKDNTLMNEQPANPLAAFKDADLIGHYRTLRDETLKAIVAKFKADAAPVQASMEMIENEMQRRLLERGANHSSTETGTAFLADGTKVECVDKALYLKFCVENFNTWGKDMLTAAAAKETVELFIEKSKSEQNPHGTSPPGIKVTYFKKCNIRK